MGLGNAAKDVLIVAPCIGHRLHTPTVLLNAGKSIEKSQGGTHNRQFEISSLPTTAPDTLQGLFVAPGCGVSSNTARFVGRNEACL